MNTFDEPIETATMVGEEMLRWLRQIDGFHGMLLISREGQTLGMTFWDSREVAERHRAARMQFLERMTGAAQVEVEDVEEYEISFAHLSPALLDGAE